jgi:hypothetical protein
MKFMMIIKANKDSEAGVMPSEKLLLAMGKYNEQLVKSGVLLAADGLQASSKGARINFANGKSTVVDGPFAESKELIAGYWIIQVKSKAEAVEWARRVPFDVDGPSGSGGQIEVRQLFETADFEPELSGSAEGRALLDAEQSFRKRTNT